MTTTTTGARGFSNFRENNGGTVVQCGGGGDGDRGVKKPPPPLDSTRCASTSVTPAPTTTTDTTTTDTTANFDPYGDSLARMQEESLLPIVEDITDWLSAIFDLKIEGSTFLDQIDNGVILCRLIAVIQQKAAASSASSSSASSASSSVSISSGKDRPVPSKVVKYRPTAESGSWYARDNIASFLRFCEQIGVNNSCMFETEDLVQHTSVRCIVLCLMDLARISTQLGLQAPSLIRLEHEISIQEIALDAAAVDTTDASTATTAAIATSPDRSTTGSRSTSSSSASASSRKRKRSVGNEIYEFLDIEIQRMKSECLCQPQFEFIRIQEGIYKIGSRRVFIRLLKEKHWMVRVGGGWNTLAAYVTGHDPCRRGKKRSNILKNAKTKSISS